jgi:hypothetical protein
MLTLLCLWCAPLRLFPAAAAQVEAEKCAIIAKEVSEKQASCEKDLAAAEPLVAQVRCGRLAS